MKEVKQTGRFVVVFVVFFLAAQFTRACIERIKPPTGLICIQNILRKKQNKKK